MARPGPLLCHVQPVDAADSRRCRPGAPRRQAGGRRHTNIVRRGPASTGQPVADLVALDDALPALEALDPRKCRVVELRFFTGLTVQETATVLDVSTDTVSRDWTFAKTWLSRELRDERPSER